MDWLYIAAAVRVILEHNEKPLIMSIKDRMTGHPDINVLRKGKQGSEAGAPWDELQTSWQTPSCQNSLSQEKTGQGQPAQADTVMVKVPSKWDTGPGELWVAFIGHYIHQINWDMSNALYILWQWCFKHG